MIERQRSQFKTAKVNARGKVIEEPACEAYYFEEELGKGIRHLEMIAIRSGEFLMGSPENEEGRSSGESPQHLVTVPPFFISKTPITQGQWRSIAQLKSVDMDLNPDPSYFKGDDRPVERVSWHEAVEFCKRLSVLTGRDAYRLPTEAEWEYACRGGTQTPFAYGETITTDLANFDGDYNTYGSAPKGQDRKQTTDVGSFPPNAFGLCDMHGNVYEWCQDTWHETYDGAPTDGSAWIDNDNDYRVLRGGSWLDYPRCCRSASCIRNEPCAQFNDNGFRVVCGAASLSERNRNPRP